MLGFERFGYMRFLAREDSHEILDEHVSQSLKLAEGLWFWEAERDGTEIARFFWP
jgi:hypothetical protein